MAKALSKSTPIRITIGLLVLVGLAIAGMSAGWVDHNSDIKAVEVKVDTVKTEGCDPAKEHVTSVAVIESRLTNIEKAQTDNTTAIIKAINEKE